MSKGMRLAMLLAGLCVLCVYPVCRLVVAQVDASCMESFICIVFLFLMFL